MKRKIKIAAVSILITITTIAIAVLLGFIPMSTVLILYRDITTKMMEYQLVLKIALIWISTMVIYRLSKELLNRTMLHLRRTTGEIMMLVKFLKYILIVMAVLFSIHQVYPIDTLLIAFGAFSGLFLGWALQQPITGMAAWIFISIKRPFKIGDRIYLPTLNIVGDVIDLDIFYTVLNQVGGTVGSEEATGRIVLIPNAMLFSTPVINYTKVEGSPYILDEVVVKVSFDSDWDEAERIMIRAAEEVTKDIIEATGVKPYTRADLYDYGVMMRLRYMTLAKDRVRISYEIVKRIVKEFQRNDRVDFAIPYVYSYQVGKRMKLSPMLTRLGKPIGF